MTISVALSASTLAAVVLLIWRFSRIQYQHEIMWRYFENNGFGFTNRSRDNQKVVSNSGGNVS